MGLQIADAAALIAPGTADHLIEQLKSPLGGARIAIAQTEIRIDDADQIEPREIMPLRHQLRADDDIDAAFRDFIQLAAHGLDRGDQVARQHHGARVRKQLRRLLLQTSTPGPIAASDSSAAQCGQMFGRGIEKPQWWQTSRWRKR